MRNLPGRQHLQHIRCAVPDFKGCAQAEQNIPTPLMSCAVPDFKGCAQGPVLGVLRCSCCAVPDFKGCAQDPLRGAGRGCAQVRVWRALEQPGCAVPDFDGCAQVAPCACCGCAVPDFDGCAQVKMPLPIEFEEVVHEQTSVNGDCNAELPGERPSAVIAGEKLVAGNRAEDPARTPGAPTFSGPNDA